MDEKKFQDMHMDTEDVSEGPVLFQDVQAIQVISER